MSLSKQDESPLFTGESDFYPSPYMHLDSVLADSDTPLSHIQPILNFPPIALQLNNTDKSRRMSEDDRQRSTGFGTVYPDDRHIVISDKVSTVVQFRNMDYAMERCILHALIPMPDGTFNLATHLQDPSEVDVWSLDITEDLTIGSVNRAPPRRDLLATLLISRSMPTQSEAFHCLSGRFTTVELSCSPAAATHCLVDFWQDQRSRPLGGIYITQYPTHTNHSFINTRSGSGED